MSQARDAGFGLSIREWKSGQIDAECVDAYASYIGQIRDGHTAYFAARPDRRSRTQPFAARTREAAFPDRWECLAATLPEPAWHRHHLSAGSSQVLAIALLASATRAEPSLQWLPGDSRFLRPLSLFEVELAPDVLNERPRQTSLDWLVVDRRHVLVAEAKFTERGLGQCSCQGRKLGVCSARVLERPYWSVASKEMGLARETPPCSLSLTYQAVRNVAAAQAIAGARSTTFLLLYDDRNPYFAGARAWPGWVRVLSQIMRRSRTTFASLSWQELLASVDLDPEVEEWARKKHRLARAA